MVGGLLASDLGRPSFHTPRVEQFEWHRPRDQAGVWGGAPRRWRQFHARGPGGPFAGRRVWMLGPPSPVASLILQLLPAGGGEARLLPGRPGPPAGGEAPSDLVVEGPVAVVVVGGGDLEAARKQLAKWLDWAGGRPPSPC